MTAPAQHGRHWATEVIPAVRHDVGSFSGTLPLESLLEQTQPFVPFDPPTVEFSRADFEYGMELDRAIAAARFAEQRRMNPSRWDRVRRCVRGWLR